jgi:hypothetical protein
MPAESARCTILRFILIGLQTGTRDRRDRYSVADVGRGDLDGILAAGRAPTNKRQTPVPGPSRLLAPLPGAAPADRQAMLR